MNWDKENIPLARPPRPTVCQGDLHVQLLGDPFYVMEPSFGVHRNTLPVIHLTGCDEHARHVCIRVHGYLPYFYADAPAWLSDPSILHGTLEQTLAYVVEKSKRFVATPYINKVELTEKYPLFRYAPEKRRMMRITMYDPHDVSTLRNIFMSGSIEYWHEGKKVVEKPHFMRGDKWQCYDADVEFGMRYLVDRNIYEGTWVGMQAGKYNLFSYVNGHEEDDDIDDYSDAPRKKRQNMSFNARMAHEADTRSVFVECAWNALFPMPKEGKWLGDSDYTVVTFDIECSGRHGIFPEPEQDAIIMICVVVNRPMHAQKIDAEMRTKMLAEGCKDKKLMQKQSLDAVRSEGHSVVFTWRPFTREKMITEISSTVVEARNESEMLIYFTSFLRWMRPEFIVSWNGHGFDEPYIVDRCTKLEIQDQTLYIGIGERKWHYREERFESKAKGARGGAQVIYDGTVFFDAMAYEKDNSKRRSYALTAVASEVLGLSKLDVHFSKITPMWNESNDARGELVKYCQWDTAITWWITYAQMMLQSTTALAAVTGCSPFVLHVRGQLAKTKSLLWRKGRERDYVTNFIPFNPKTSDDKSRKAKFEGATVIEPKVGFYQRCVIVNDFKSLYPSCMIRYNLCLSTLIPPELVQKIPTEDREFCRDTRAWFYLRRKGICCEIVEDLVGSRRRTQKMQNDAENDGNIMLARYLERQQLMEKIAANGIYGSLGSPAMQFAEVSATVTARGREMLELARIVSNELFPLYIVIYGDTDSTMTCTDHQDVARALEEGQLIADEVNKRTKRPIELAMEKVYFPYLLLKKKRYAAMLWTIPKAPSYMDTKGLETKRRDNCEIISKTLEKVLVLLVREGKRDDAIALVKDTLSDMLQQKIPISQFIKSKQLAHRDEDYNKKNPPEHVIVNREIERRDGKGAAFLPGDRVPYVICKGIGKEKVSQCAYYPPYAEQDGRYIDVEYYTEKFINTFKRVLDIVERPGFTEQKIARGEHMRKRMLKSNVVGPLDRMIRKIK